MRSHPTRSHAGRPASGSEAGATAVEFVLIAPLLVVLIFGTIVFGISFHRVQGMQATARESARLAAVGATVSEIESRARVTGTPTIEAADLVVVVERLDAADNPTTMTSGSTEVACDQYVLAAEKVRVRVSVADPASYALNIPFFGPVDSTYNAEAVFRCE